MSTASPAEVEVLIVGYGPVGATIACLLGQYGVRALAVDKASDVLESPRAIALDNEALRILQLAGLSDDAFARVVIPQVRMVSPQVGEFARVDTSGTVDDHPKLVTFYQPDLERALRRQAAIHPSVTTALGVELVSFVDDGDAVWATLRAADGTDQRVRAAFLVGADGASSRVRGAIGQDFRGTTYGEDWLIVDARDVPGDFDHVEFVCDHRRPSPHMVAPGGRTRWEFMLRPGERREDMERDEVIRDLLRPWSGGRELTIERKAVYRFHARCCDSFRRGRVFLAGDAAHVTPPFAGQGLVAGLRDAANLSWKLAWVVRGAADPAILDSYDQERRPHASKMIGLAKFVGRLVMPRNRAMATLIHGAMKIGRQLPVVRPMLEELGIKPRPVFARGLFARGRGRLERGGLFPQAARSDDALGPHLALVGLGADPGRHVGAATRQRWAARGGTIAHGIVDAAVAPEVVRRGWCAVVRPDRTILHDGPAADAERIVTEAMALLSRWARSR